MIVAEYLAGEHAHGEDDNGEPLCSLPTAPASCPSAALVDIARTAATALHREYSHDLPPAEPPTV